MIHRLFCVTFLGLALLITGCTPTCQGDSCSRPQSNDDLVVWWPSHMRAEPGPSGERSDYQTVPLER
ncbi:HrpT family type III secretion system protein [Pseudomonas karstica]|uniref:HrpT family type III secretion system protein n=1 Tax=Pseudomonas karstica TaxID=1055468 RepID=UPI001FE6B944|nr:HrpT family type III secretion system protein [Pseudomonas karstica]